MSHKFMKFPLFNFIFIIYATIFTKTKSFPSENSLNAFSCEAVPALGNPFHLAIPVRSVEEARFIRETYHNKPFINLLII